jgi:hypothetical protein
MRARRRPSRSCGVARPPPPSPSKRAGACATCGGWAGDKPSWGAAGAARAVVEAMRAHRASKDVQRNGCYALADGHAGNQAAGEATGAAPAVVAAMNAYRGSEGVDEGLRSAHVTGE